MRPLAQAWDFLLKAPQRQASVYEWAEGRHPEHGDVTEYHGTIDLPSVLREGITGSNPQQRSKRYVPEELRDADRITYTSPDREKALAFARNRALRMKTDPRNVGVVGVRGSNLPPPVEHQEPEWGDFAGTTSRVRVGGLPREYLVPVEHDKA